MPTNWTDKLVPLVRPMIFTLIVGLLTASGIFEPFERGVLNYHFLLRGPITPFSPIVIVSIDEDSFDELNLQWPWPRSLHAQLIDQISLGKPTVIGFDVLFTEPSKLGPEDDAALGEAIRRAGNVVLAAGLTFFEGQAFLKHSLNPPIKPIRQHARGFGPVNYPLEDDAFIRKSTLSVSFQGRDRLGFDALLFQETKKFANLNSTSPPQEFLINFRGGPTTFETLSYYRILVGEIPPSYFHEKIVLIGATSPLLRDIYATPVSPIGNMPGVEVHANALDTLLRGDPISQTPFPITLSLMFIAAMVAIWMTNRLHPLSGLMGMLGIILSIFLLQHILFVYAQLWWDAMPIPLITVVAFSASILENFLQERREKKWLAQYFSPNLVNVITQQARDRPLVPQRRKVTVLFSDIRDFSALSHSLTPEEVAAFLRDYFTEMTDAVFLHGGMVDKYMGDAIMALYNVPLDQPDHAAQAVYTSLDFHKRLAAIRQRVVEQTGKDVVLRCGFGIHTGEAVVGTIGSQQRLEYTAVGETINIGANLESLSKQFADAIIISEATYQEVKDCFPCHFAGEEQIKGHDHPLKIYTITPE